MRLLDRKLTSPHFLAVFEGGHTLPPDDIALDALEWLELQAMQSGRRRRDDALVGRILEKRRSRIQRRANVTETVYLLRALVSDFKGLADVSAEAGRLEELSRQSDVKKALKRERDADDAEERLLREIFELEAQLGDENRRSLALMTLRDRLSTLSRKAAVDADRPSAARHGASCGRLLREHRRGCRIGSISRCWTSIVRSGGDGSATATGIFNGEATCGSEHLATAISKSRRSGSAAWD